MRGRWEGGLEGCDGALEGGKLGEGVPDGMGVLFFAAEVEVLDDALPEDDGADHVCGDAHVGSGFFGERAGVARDVVGVFVFARA